jgi:hypothetical protein
MRRVWRAKRSRRHCPEERSDEGITEAIAKPVAARPEHATDTCHCEERSDETISCDLRQFP